MVKVITQMSEIPKDKKVVVDFFATWCGPCNKIAPFFVELSERYSDVVFLKVDVDLADALASELDIRSLPTFVFMNNGGIVNRLEGAHQNSLLLALDKLRNL